MTTRRLLVGLGVTVGIFLVALGIGVLTTWELTIFRLTTFDHDFTGLVCGSPWNNPGWETGTPCHGAVNRQTAFGLALTAGGVGLLVISLVFGFAHDRRVRSDR